MYQNSLEFARQADIEDSLAGFREKFHIPLTKSGEECIYLCGNSLGLQPRQTRDMVLTELDDWKKLGVEGHFKAHNPWMPYHEFLTEAMAEIVGARNHEVVVMNTLTVNLHLMMVSFYRPSEKRRKILIEYDAFPSDKYAVASQLRFHGYDPDECMIQLKARHGEYLVRHEDILDTLDRHGEEIALVMMGNTNYYTGQFFDMKSICAKAHSKGCMIGFDCAHGAGNVELDLHNSGVDFAVWCSYKYLNSGPGSIGACFVHERHAADQKIPRFEGWWGHNKQTRFGMRDDFEAMYGVEAWQLSNPPILSMVAVWSSLKIFREAGMANLRKKSIQLTGFLEYLIHQIDNKNIQIISPSDPERRGSQLSIRIQDRGKEVFKALEENGVIADWREPDVIRVAPAALYNSFTDVYKFYLLLDKIIGKLN